MKKYLLKSIVALAALCLGTLDVAAQNETTTVPVKMTYIDYDQPDVAMGQCDTIKVGWNKGNLVAVGSTIAFGNTGWGANWIGVLKVDVSSIPGTVQTAKLVAKVSGSLDNKRTTGWGVAQTDNEWSDDLTYTTAGSWTVSALLNGGVQVWSTSKSATTFDTIELDITDALAGGNPTATLLVYQGIVKDNMGAAGGYMTEAAVEVEYEPFEATTTKYDFEDDNVVFSNGTNSGNGRVTAAIENDATLGSNVLGWTNASNSGNGYTFSYFDFTNLLDKPALVKVEFDYYNTAGGRARLTIGDALVRGTDGHHGKASYNANGAIFCIGSEKTGNANEAFINGTNLPQADKTVEEDILDEEGNPTGEKKTVTTAYGICNKWLHVTVMANNDTKTVAWAVADQEGNVLYSGNEAFYAEDANECTQIDLFSYINSSHCAMIDNLSITNYKSNAQFADYTIQYVDAESNQLKDSRTGNGQVGKFVNLLDSDKAAIRTDDMKYIYESDDAAEVAIVEDGSAVITVKFREAEKYYAVLNCVIDGKTMSTGGLAQFRDNNTQWFWEGDSYTLYPARAYKYSGDGLYYTTEATSWNGVSFSFPGSVSPVKQGTMTYYIGTLYYTLDESIAYYSDIERLALPVEDEGNGTGLGQLVGTVNSWWSFSGGYFDRFAGGRGIRLDAGSYVYTEPIAEEGTYMVTIYGRNDRSEVCNNPYALGLRDADGNVTYLDVAVPDWGSATTGANVIGNAAVEAQEATEETDAVEAVEAAGIGIPAGFSLVVVNTGNGNYISLDDIKLTKVADYAETPTKAPAYTVAGAYVVEGSDEQNAAFFGTAWTPSLVANDLTENEDGTFTKKFGAVKFEQPGTIYYKVAVNHGWVESYGFDGNNADYYVEVPGGATRTADVVFTFDPTTKTVSCALENLTYTATFINTKDWEKVCVWAWNGDYNMYNAWPGVEATKTGEQKYDHDVYTWCYTGPVAPSMIIFNNGDNGEKTEDLEFVNGAIYAADGIATNINTITANNQNAVIYNLKGQRVLNAQKGLYIQNGKKFVVK